MKKLLLLSFLAIIGQLYAQTTVPLFLPVGNYTVPCGVTSLTVHCYGGGGGGAGDNTINAISGGGGGGGGYSTAVIAVVPGQVIPYNVGGAGAAGGAGVNGGNGGNTSFGGFVVAGGGSGGQAATGVGGAGGAGATTPGTAGSNGTALMSGAGGASGGGAAGGAAVLNDANGLIGGSPGGGGSGGIHSNGATNTGGGGRAGLIIVIFQGPNAGPDQYLSCTSSTVMAANTPAVGGGFWTQVSGPACTIDFPNSPTTTVTGLTVPSVVVLRWNWAPGGCPAVSDLVTINAGICSDEACSATPIPVNTTCTYSNYANSNSTGSVTPIDPGCGNFTDNDMWYSAVVPANGTLTVQTVDAAGGTGMLPCLAFYSGPDCNNLMHQGCAFSSTLGVPAVGTYVGTPGETVYIRIWDYTGAEGVYSICAFTNTNTPGTIVEGDNTITCAGPSVTFSDPGGTGNYSANSSAIYTICPDDTSQYITVSFTSFNLQNGFDYLTVIDGDGASDPYIANYTGATLPPTITSSAPGGCLTFAFYSDNTTVAPGWLANVDCTNTPGVNVPFCSTTNCAGECGTWICQDGLFPTNNPGTVGVQEFLEQVSGCMGGTGEVATQWFYFTALTTGTITMTFDGPNGQNYDFAIWGPDTTGTPPCPLNTGMAPIRCSNADPGGNPTGLAAGAGDFYEGLDGDNFVEDLDVIAGETYALVLNIVQNGNPQPIIDLSIGGTGTLDCTPLPVELLNFDGIHEDGYNRVRWTSASEMNNDYYTLFYGDDAVNYDVLTVNPGIGNSNVQTQYGYSHISPYAITYYKLRQTDYDGDSKEYGPISISKMSNGTPMVFNVYPNPASSGWVNIYSDYDGPLTLNLIDNLGRAMVSQQIMGSGINQFNLEGIGSGIYYLQVVSEKGIERIEKLIVN